MSEGAGAPGAPAAPGGVPVAVVVVAMEPEAAPFLALADAVGASRAVGHAAHTDLVLAGRTVRLVRSGIGQVAATAAAVLALHELGPVPLVSAGSAGGLAAGVHVGDVVVGTRYRFAGADATAFGYAPGQIPGQPVAFEGATALVAAGAAATIDDGAVRPGEIIAGDAFVDARTVEQFRHRFPEALATDMETTALAEVAALMGAPFVSVRGISDLCGPAAGDDFRTHVDDAADRSAAVVRAVIAGL